MGKWGKTPNPLAPDVEACATPTTIMLKALTKHFTKLSRYSNTNETSSPQVANATTAVHIAASLNPSLFSAKMPPRQTLDRRDSVVLLGT